MMNQDPQAALPTCFSMFPSIYGGERDDSSNFHLDVPSLFLLWAPGTAYRKY